MNTSSASTADNRLATANAVAAAAAASNRTFTSPSQPQRPIITTISQPRHSYPSPQQQQQKLFTAQSHSTTARHPNPNPPLHPQYYRPHDSLQPPQQPPPPPHQGILYPVASSGRGFIQRPLRPQPPDQIVTVANPGAYPPRPVITFPHQVARPYGFSNSESLNHPVHMIAPPYVQHPNFGVTTGAVLAPIRGVPVSAHPKVASSPSIISDSNGHKDSRERSREDAFVTIRDRKVRIRDGASLYVLCRSWMRNGTHEESQSQNGANAKCLPRPLPIPVAGSHLPTKKEDEDQENEGSVQHLSAEELLQRHIQRAKRVRARLREERLQRIARYKARLATLLPPPVEQLADDTTT